VPQLDWDRAFKEYLPLVEKEQSLLDYYRTLQRFTALLKDGHTNVYLPQTLTDQMDNLPIILDYIEEQWVVVERWPTREIMEEDIPVGSVVLTIEEVSPTQYFENNMFPYIAHGTIQGKRNKINWMDFFANNAVVSIKFRYPDNSIHSRVIRANRESVKWTPELQAEYLSSLRKGPSFFTKTLYNNTLYVRYRTCDSDTEEKFCSLIENMDTLEFPNTIILDLRGNGGGNTPLRAISRLITDKVYDRYSKTRCSISSVDASIQINLERGMSKDDLSNEINDAVKKGQLPKGYSLGCFF
jgi:carboxyl-terminal processing protease